MSVKTDVINLQINVNSNEAQNQLNELRNKSNATRLAMEGLSKRSKEYKEKKQELADLDAQMSKLKQTIGLTALSQKELEKELSKLERFKKSAVPMSDEYKKWVAEIDKVKNRLYEVKNNVTGFSKVFSKIKDEVKQFGAMAAAYLGFQFISEQFSNIIRNAGKTSDQLADLRRVSGLTAEEVNGLNKSLSALDTRTSTGSLRDIAIIAGKLGVAKQDILGFTEAVDKLVVSLGDELGSADQITTSLGKILNVFDGKVTGDNITKLGNSFVVMANAGVASGGYIADFTQRVAAVAKASNLALGSVVGLGAGFEEMGLKSESVSTAFQKVIGDMASDLPKAAKLAGAKTKAEIDGFIKLFNNSPEQAFIKFAEGLSKNKSGFAEITASMKDAGEEGARVVAMLNTVGQAGDFFRGKIDQGSESLKDATAINEAFALKNETLGSSIDKLGKEFTRLISGTGVTSFVTGLISSFTKLIVVLKSAPQWFSENRYWIYLLVTGLVLMNATYIRNAIAIAGSTNSRILNTAATKAGTAIAAIDNAMTALSTAAKTIYSSVVALLTNRITMATAAQRIWAAALTLGLGPIGILITTVALLAGGIGALASGFKDSNDYASAFTETLKESAKETAKQKSEIQSLVAVASDHNISLETRKANLEKLINISPEYLGRLTLENIATAEGKAILDQYNLALEKNADLKAANVLKDKEYENNTRLKALRQELEVAQKLKLGYAELSDEAKDAFGSMSTSVGRTAMTSDLFNRDISASDFKEAFKVIDEEMGKSQKKLTAYTDNLKERTTDVSDARRTFLLKEITAYRQEMMKFEKGTEGYIKAAKKFDEAYDKFSNEFNGKKKTKVVSDSNIDMVSADEKKAREKAAKDRAAEQKREEDQLLRDAEKFRKEIDRLKTKASNGTLTDREREREVIEQQFEDLTNRAKKFWADSSAMGKAAAEDIRKIRLDQIQTLMKKYFAEDAAKEYQESLKLSEDYFDDQRRLESASYASGTISKKQYEQNLSALEDQEVANRLIIAKDYSATVTKASEDVTVFMNKQEDLRVKKAIESNEKKKATADAEALAGLRLNVITAPKGSQREVDAKRELLRKQFELDTEYLDKKSNAYLEKEAELNKQLEDLAIASFKNKLDRLLQVVDYFAQAMGAINTMLTNRENRELQRDKKANDTRRTQYTNQLNGRLISQERYDKKMAALQQEEDKKAKEIQLKQAKRDRALAVFNAIISMAAGIAKAIPNLALMALAGVVGGLQIAAIKNAPLPEMGTGGLLRNGPKHKDQQKGLHVVNPLTGRTEMLLEQGEAVIAARAMTNRRVMTVTGTGAQITSAVNSANGGVSFAGGAQVKWHSTPTPSYKPSFVKMMATGGIVGTGTTSSTNDPVHDYTALFQAMIAQQVQMREDMANWQTNLKSHVVFGEYKTAENLLNKAKATGAIDKRN